MPDRAFRQLPASLFLFAACSPSVTEGDWPQWRADASRSAATAHELPAELHLQWSRSYGRRTQTWDDTLNNDMMSFDRALEPVVADGRMFVGFNDKDKVVALDVETGRELWTFYTDGPVRLPPAVWRGRVFAASDDGHLYCLDAATGRALWKVRGGPSDRKVLGNRRVISMWPARGGPVVRDDTVYFAASVWPFLGTFVYALDAATGTVKWINDTTGDRYMVQPHGAPAFAGLAPQGALVATEEFLVIPGGRSLPAIFDRETGALRHFTINHGKGEGGGSFVVADDARYFVHTRGRSTRAYDLRTGAKQELAISEPVLFDGALFAADGKHVQASKAREKWRLPIDVDGDLIKSGSRLYVSGSGEIVALDLPDGDVPPRISWSVAVGTRVPRLLAASGKLVAVTADGRILVYGERRLPPTEHAAVSTPFEPASTAAGDAILAAGGTAGYALCYGVDDGALLVEIVQRSELRVVAIEPDRSKLAALRRRLDAAGLYGTRVSLHYGDPIRFAAPPYIADVVWFGTEVASRLEPEQLGAAYGSVRPFGGALWVPPTAAERLLSDSTVASLERAERSANTLRRVGPLPGSADWSHQYGDLQNTVKSNDSRVRLPLAPLWFGGNSNEDVLPRHSHGPREQVVDGRLVIEGDDSISARDVYTGRDLWKRTLPQLANYGVYFDDTYTKTPLEISYNQVHIPGANARGTNFVATAAGVYVAAGPDCLVLDNTTGETLRTITMPERDGATPAWGFLGVDGEVVLGGWGFTDFSTALGNPEGRPILDRSMSRGLVAFDASSGRVLWTSPARHGFWHNGIVAGNGRVYCLDMVPQSVRRALRATLENAPPARIVALDRATGEGVWETEEHVFGTWLAYSLERDLLLQAGARAPDRLADEVGKGMVVYRGATGSVQWQALDRRYTGPCILHGDRILTNVASNRKAGGAFDLRTGAELKVENPLTGADVPWTMSRQYGCNTVIASENLLTFRSGAASFFDLTTNGGTGNFGGLRSGCTSNLVVANGVLNAPDFTRTCLCQYQNQTSLALIHMPELVNWTVTQFGVTADDAIERLGVNLGAPGDRRAPTGTLWLEHPAAGGRSPDLEIAAFGERLALFRRHPTAVAGEPRFVAASGASGIETLTIAVGGPSREFDVRLVFAEPEDVAVGQRIFDVVVQGETVLRSLDVAARAGGARRTFVAEVPGVRASDRLTIALRRGDASRLPPILCGIELVRAGT